MDFLGLGEIYRVRGKGRVGKTYSNLRTCALINFSTIVLRNQIVIHIVFISSKKNADTEVLQLCVDYYSFDHRICKIIRGEGQHNNVT